MKARRVLQWVAVMCGVVTVVCVLGAIWSQGSFLPPRLITTAFVFATILTFAAVGGWS